MEHEVFISYSRKDIDIANRLCVALEKAGFRFWIDRNIHGSANFLSEITQCIRNCKVVIFIASAHSSASPWTQKEVLFALKHNKEIIPYRIGSFAFEDNDELDLVFTNVQWVESVQSVIESLISLGCTRNPPEDKSNTYKVGDYFNENGKKGVVFQVWDGGRHGKIISLDQIKAKWDSWLICVEKKRLFRPSEYEYENVTRTYADSRNDGMSNTNKVIARVHNNYFDAFIWCRNKGNDWYLPALEELKIIYNMKGKLNETLCQYGETTIADFLYWSSTEYNDYDPKVATWFVDMRNGNANFSTKSHNLSVRAVSTF